MSSGKISDNQGSLFEAVSCGADGETVRTWKDTLGQPEETQYPITYGRPGSYVKVTERAQYLIGALNAMSQRNIRDGLSVAAYTMPDSRPIWKNYQENTQTMLRGAERNRKNFEKELRCNFWQATGFAALRGMGLIRESQINPRAQKMWRDFNHRYGHPSDVKSRNKYKERLEKSLKSLEEGSNVAA